MKNYGPEAWHHASASSGPRGWLDEDGNPRTLRLFVHGVCDDTNKAYLKELREWLQLLPWTETSLGDFSNIQTWFECNT